MGSQLPQPRHTQPAMESLTHLLLLLGVSLINASIYLSEDSNRKCTSPDVCVKRFECGAYNGTFHKLNQLTKGSSEYLDKLNEIKSTICNKLELGVCCEDPTPNASNSAFFEQDKCCSACQWSVRRKSCVSKKMTQCTC